MEPLTIRIAATAYRPNVTVRYCCKWSLGLSIVPEEMSAFLSAYSYVKYGTSLYLTHTKFSCDYLDLDTYSLGTLRNRYG